MWKRDGEAGLSPIVFSKGDPDAPRGGVTAVRYREVLEEGLLPLYEAGDPFMQDNVPAHVQAGSPEWLERHGIFVIEWPAHSPDLNPIEHFGRF